MIYPLENDQLTSLFFSADDQHLGFSRVGLEIHLWQVNPAREYRALLGNVGTPYEIESVDFSPDGRLFAAASEEGIVLWDPVCGRKLTTLPEASTKSAFFDPASGELMASSSLFGSVGGRCALVQTRKNLTIAWAVSPQIWTCRGTW